MQVVSRVAAGDRVSELEIPGDGVEGSGCATVDRPGRRIARSSLLVVEPAVPGAAATVEPVGEGQWPRLRGRPTERHLQPVVADLGPPVPIAVEQQAHGERVVHGPDAQRCVEVLRVVHHEERRVGAATARLGGHRDAEGHRGRGVPLPGARDTVDRRRPERAATPGGRGHGGWAGETRAPSRGRALRSGRRGARPRRETTGADFLGVLSRSCSTDGGRRPIVMPARRRAKGRMSLARRRGGREPTEGSRVGCGRTRTDREEVGALRGRPRRTRVNVVSVVALDIGTSRMKALLASWDGSITAEASVPTPVLAEAARTAVVPRGLDPDRRGIARRAPGEGTPGRSGGHARLLLPRHGDGAAGPRGAPARSRAGPDRHAPADAPRPDGQGRPVSRRTPRSHRPGSADAVLSPALAVVAGDAAGPHGPPASLPFAARLPRGELLRSRRGGSLLGVAHDAHGPRHLVLERADPRRRRPARRGAARTSGPPPRAWPVGPAAASGSGWRPTHGWCWAGWTIAARSSARAIRGSSAS